MSVRQLLKVVGVSLMRRQAPASVIRPCNTENLGKSSAQVATSVIQAAPVIQKSCGLKPERNPSSPVPIRYSEKQLRIIDIKAKKASVSRSEYIRATSLDGDYTKPLGSEVYAELLKLRRQLTGIATNINQMAHHMNNGSADAWQAMEFLEGILEPLLQTLSLVRQALERGQSGSMP